MTIGPDRRQQKYQLGSALSSSGICALSSSLLVRHRHQLDYAYSGLGIEANAQLLRSLTMLLR